MGKKLGLNLFKHSYALELFLRALRTHKSLINKLLIRLRANLRVMGSFFMALNFI